MEDVDGDGTTDIIAGNLGLNSKFKASVQAPLRMYVNDFDGNGKSEQLVTVVDGEGRERLFATKDELAKQIAYLGRRFKTYRSFAEASLTEVVDRRKLQDAIRYEVTELRSSVFYNREEGFQKRALPAPAQMSPIHAIGVFDGAKSPLVVTAGNFYDANIQRGRYDAGYGTLLTPDANGLLQAVPNRRTNWFQDGAVRRMRSITIAGQPALILAVNDAPLQFLKINKNAAVSPAR